MKVYGFPGLGFNVKALDPLQHEIPTLQPIGWTAPIPTETLSQYAARVARKIKLDSETVLIGHSLGGMLVQELAALVPVRKVILISSITCAEENPWYFKLLAPLGLNHLFSRTLTTRTLQLWGPAHDYCNGQEQEVFTEMVRSYSRAYYRWALRELSRWKVPQLPKDLPLVRLHGTNDLTFPLRSMRHIDYEIKDAGHFMLFKKASEIAPILHKEIQS